MNQWREELDTLRQQAETSLLIVDTMSGVLVESVSGSCDMLLCLCLSECVQLVMDDAKKKKLDDMKLKNLLQLRDSPMTMASIHTMGLENCKACYEGDGDQVCNFFHHVLFLLLLLIPIHLLLLLLRICKCSGIML